MSRELLIAEIEKLYSTDGKNPESESFVERFLELLDIGEVRAAEPDPSCSSGWKVNQWVKKGILLAFRIGKLIKMGNGWSDQFFDKHTLPVKDISIEDQIRVVPGGTAIRRGAYISHGTVIMPPSYVNVGAFVDEGTMLDSHSLVGSCAQVGKKVHVSAGTQIGGVLEPVGAFPVIIEDEVMLGGNCGIYEGAIVKRRAVIGAGCIITGSTPIYDLVKNKIYRREKGQPLIVPEGAVVVPGSRDISKKSKFGSLHGLSLYAPLIVKYRDEKTDAATVLEEGLR
ncbi:MAG TPA: 2,3,4,5-tetrahydropyridine-2,6-dicarboxylate N-succinyltransferase [Candidatus Acidoferrales bacterium]|nr:2,3,4,5-tetrahydropyridine-2,6-dicarboxylate N-succinyltransferase [Candidatus Acidoferrales bacterium]